MKLTSILLTSSILLLGLTGCQTRITIESEAQPARPIYSVASINGTNTLYISGYKELRPRYYITLRSPLWAEESVAHFAANVGAGGVWSIDGSGYHRNLSSNAVDITREMFAGGAQLVTAIGDAYVKIAGGGAQATTVMDVAKKVYGAFADGGGDVSKATVTSDGGTISVSDGTICTTCDANGNCTTGACNPAAQTSSVKTSYNASGEVVDTPVSLAAPTVR